MTVEFLGWLIALQGFVLGFHFGRLAERAAWLERERATKEDDP